MRVRLVMVRSRSAMQTGLNQGDFVFLCDTFMSANLGDICLSGREIVSNDALFPQIAIKSSFYDDKNMCLLISGRKSPHFWVEHWSET